MTPRMLAACAALLFAGGCAASRPAHERVGRVGMSLCPDPEGLRVVRVAARSPAWKSGIREGDLLIGLRDLDLADGGNRKTLLWEIRAGAGKRLDLSLKRSGRTLRVQPEPALKDSGPKEELLRALRDEVVCGRAVSAALAVTQVNHANPESFANAQGLEAWKNGVRDSVENLFEGLLLNKWLLRCGNYSVVDRGKTRQVLSELNFQKLGTVSPETEKEAGKMTGASHLLFVSLTRYRLASGGYQDSVNARLICVESGAVAASVKLDLPVPED